MEDQAGDMTAGLDKNYFESADMIISLIFPQADDSGLSKGLPSTNTDAYLTSPIPLSTDEDTLLKQMVHFRTFRGSQASLPGEP